VKGEQQTLSYGSGARRVLLEACYLGEQVLVVITNENGHIGAVALAEYDVETQRVSTSVLTRISHKDDVVAVGAAYRLAKAGKCAVCVIAGIHIDHATLDDIEVTQQNAALVVDMLVERGFLGGPREAGGQQLR